GGGRVIAFATGRAAMVSRLLAVAAGSPLVYAATAAGRETAPGQPALAELRAALPPRSGGAGTAVFAVVGRPVAHSISPPVHSAALRVLGLDAMFLAFEPDDFGGLLDLVTPLPFVRGLAVTAPFKEDALKRSDRADDATRGMAAANTLIRADGGWRAANTDADGAADAIEAGLGAKLVGRAVLVVGTGGAARAVAAGVRRRGARLRVAGRNRARAEALARRFGGDAVGLDEIAGAEHDVLVHATPVGQWPGPDESVVPAEAVRAGSLVVDAVVRPVETRLAAIARERGARFVPGVEWFLRQAARQLHAFTGMEPPEPVMRAAALEALKREPKPLPGLVATESA
ncbi:MAG TPA: type I 3-dehydroquinate dehydratase, partial [Planctomycetota bacterium]|nr:type I 3-dehydroquinate dehydratase [Planctomycetota bacterium]